MADIPVLDIDPFTLHHEDDPDEAYRLLREAGPVCYLARYNVWAVGRFAEVRAVLRHHESFCSSGGAGLTNIRDAGSWRTPSVLLETDPPEHSVVRRVAARVMSPRGMEHLRREFEHQAEGLIGDLVGRAAFDGVTELAEAFPLRTFPDAVGITGLDRQNLLAYGSLAFNGFGPANELFAKALTAGARATTWVDEQCRRRSVAPGGLGEKVFAAVDDDEISEAQGERLVRSMLSGGIATTTQGLAWTLHLLATHPAQWRLVKENPSLLRGAFEEGLRHSSPTQLMFRTSTREVRLAGASIPAGAKVLCHIGSANRDPREWVAPERFDVLRRPASHLAFGSGIHACIGAAVVRSEAEALLEVLTRRVQAVEELAPPTRQLNNVMRALATLPLRFRRS